ncbi:Panacea domain-containing protein [Pseudonocardia sp. GCM10023141]|uniref:Panacea domain-containing protein n=1 Tax=Pseudonocardia sp. GCM10023141 TaxID=3252653 RepID=UPI00360D6B8C
MPVLAGRQDVMLAANDVASVIIARSGGRPLTSWSLQKLLYYVQAWHVAITDEPLFPERFQAYTYGPVIPQVRHDRMDMATRRPSEQRIEGIKLDQLASDLIDLIIAVYGSMSGDELSNLTHLEKPWLEARGDLPSDAPSSEPISTQAMATFYRSERMLGGRTAADLAVGGIHLQSQSAADPVDVGALLASLDAALADPGEDPWGGANLPPVDDLDMEGIETAHRRANLDQ